MARQNGGGSYRGRNNNSNRSRSGRGGGRGRGGYGGGRGRSRNRFKKPKSLDRNLFINELGKDVNKGETKFEGAKYTDFKLDPKIQSNLDKKGFVSTTEIQDKTIPMIMNGDDVLGISATGSGKTGAFLIPMIQKMLQDGNQKLLVVAPTRELALQILKEAASFMKGTSLQSALIIGGESMGKQISQLRRGGDIIVGTPGRLKDMVDRGEINLYHYNNVVIDEVDRMLDMGFIEDIRFLFVKLAPERQSLFFSATHNNSVEKIVDSLTDSYDIVKLANNKPSERVVQSVIDYSHSDEKIEMLEDILKRDEVEKAIIFVETKRYADTVEKILRGKRFKTAAIHGDKRQNNRKRVIGMFKDSKVDFLVATNVAARGIDIDDITHIINLDEPTDFDEYIHRIGRTGRNGSIGTAYTFVKRK